MSDLDRVAESIAFDLDLAVRQGDGPRIDKLLRSLYERTGPAPDKEGGPSCD